MPVFMVKNNVIASDYVYPTNTADPFGECCSQILNKHGETFPSFVTSMWGWIKYKEFRLNDNANMINLTHEVKKKRAETRNQIRLFISARLNLFHANLCTVLDSCDTSGIIWRNLPCWVGRAKFVRDFCWVDHLGIYDQRQVTKTGAWHHALHADHWHYFNENQWPIDVEKKHMTLS